MYQYKHGKLTREEFEVLYRKYLTETKQDIHDWDVATEWKYYEKGRSWFAAWLDSKLGD